MKRPAIARGPSPSTNFRLLAPGYSATAISLAFSFFLIPPIETNDEFRIMNDEYAESDRNLLSDPLAEPLGEFVFGEGSFGEGEEGQVFLDLGRVKLIAI